MENRQRELVVVVALVLSAAVPRLARAQDGTATGQLTLNGQTVALTHAYASAQPGFFDKSTEDVRILLSDVALPDNTRADVFQLIRMGREGAARVVEVVIDASGDPIRGSFYATAFDGSVSATGMHKFERQSLDRQKISGRLWMSEPHEFHGVTFQYDALFSAPIPRPPTAEELSAAIDSPPAIAAAAALKAVLGGDRAAFLATLAEGATDQYQGQGGAERLAYLKAETPADSAVVGLDRPSETTARATVNGTRDGIVIEFTIDLVLDAGHWRVIRFAE